jgi:uncharacterized membrane protein SirB2
MAAVATSYLLFVVRGVWMIRELPRLAKPAVKIVPHLVETVLLASAIVLAVMSGQYPLESGWLTANVVALVVYIILGTIALKRRQSKRTRVTAWLPAQIVFAYIVAVAITRSQDCDERRSSAARA